MLKQARGIYSVEDAGEAEGEASAGANTGDAEEEDTGEVEVEATQRVEEPLTRPLARTRLLQSQQRCRRRRLQSPRP